MYLEGVTVISQVADRDAIDGAVVLEALALEPSAVVYDLADGRPHNEPLSATFDAVDAYLSLWSGTPLLVHIPDETQAAALRAHPLARHVTTWPTLASAMEAARQHLPLDRSTLDLEAVLSAPRAARDLVDRTFAGWHLQKLANDAKLVLTEMVTNAVVHGRTPMTVSLSRHRRAPSIRVAVRDGNATLPLLKPWTDPVLPGARGLWIVGSVAQSWGTTPLNGGKVVWAVLESSVGVRAPDGKAWSKIW